MFVAQGGAANMEPFRFVQAGDFHLEQCIHGLEEAPEALRDLIIDAPFVAARRVFEIAIAEKADFVVLTGDILHPQQAGPRAMGFLIDQFELLKAENIAVYWAGGRVDSPERWPEAIRLPSNVHWFPAGRLEFFAPAAKGLSLCHLLGASLDGNRAIRTTDYETDENKFTIAVAPGRMEADGLVRPGIHYWCLGGESKRRVVAAAPVPAHQSGSPQGRSPADTGPHGCLVVHVSDEAKLRVHFTPTDVIRFHTETLVMPLDATRIELQQAIREKANALRLENEERKLFVTWKIHAPGALGYELRHTSLANDLIGELRDDFGKKGASAWTVGVDCETNEDLPHACYEEDTILGDFLRTTRRYEQDESEDLALSAQVVEGDWSLSAPELVAIGDDVTRTQILREAAVLGIDLLAGESGLKQFMERHEAELADKEDAE
jgi:exonuclease SbcD